MNSVLKQFDKDGALEETAELASSALTRGGLLKRAGAGAAVVAGGSAFAGLMPAIAKAGRLPDGDVAILNFALTLEYLEAAFYNEAKTSGALKGETLRFAHVVSQHEASHVAFLQQVLGTRAGPKPLFDFKGTTKDQAKFQATADVLENTGVHAYLGQVPNIKTPAVLVGAGRILPVEARHAAWMRDIRFHGGTSSPTTPAPGAFEDGFSKDKILAAVTATGFIR
ncbi:MAG: ferritin-like domain-containing protein [Actinobacteria bacterium]|nr:ferritin-like domain-containing protein [Actinomycetota bacterium]